MSKKYEESIRGLEGSGSASTGAASQQRHPQSTPQRLLEESKAEIEVLKKEMKRLTQENAETRLRESVLIRRLAKKEQECEGYISQIAEYKAAQTPSEKALRTAFLDPAVNLLFQKLKTELTATETKLTETQNELLAWKFTPDSRVGKQLMNRCRELYEENDQLGKMVSSGRVAKLETELAMQKKFVQEMKTTDTELNNFLVELDDDVEEMQSSVLYLQQKLKKANEHIQILENEIHQLKNGMVVDVVPKQEDAIATLPLAGFSGSANIADAYRTQQQPTPGVGINTNGTKLPITPLKVVDENACLLTHPVAAVGNYNGGGVVDERTTTMSATEDDPTASKNTDGAATSVAAQKRLYNCKLSPNESNSVTMPLVAIVDHELPPKMAKLHVTTRQHDEISLN